MPTLGGLRRSGGCGCDRRQRKRAADSGPSLGRKCPIRAPCRIASEPDKYLSSFAHSCGKSSGQRDARRLETVAVALLTSLTFPPGALFDRLRRALYPDENSTATRKIGQIVASPGSEAVRPTTARGPAPTVRPNTSAKSRPRRLCRRFTCANLTTRPPSIDSVFVPSPASGAGGEGVEKFMLAWQYAAPWLGRPRSRQFGLAPAPTAPQFVHAIRDPNETGRASGPVTSADAMHCAALVSMLNSLQSFVCRDETLGGAWIEAGGCHGQSFLGNRARGPGCRAFDGG
jgi:hypothetical protein